MRRVDVVSHLFWGAWMVAAGALLSSAGAHQDVRYRIERSPDRAESRRERFNETQLGLLEAIGKALDDIINGRQVQTIAGR
jgi:hypothetical protein